MRSKGCFSLICIEFRTSARVRPKVFSSISKAYPEGKVIFPSIPVTFLSGKAVFPYMCMLE